MKKFLVEKRPQRGMHFEEYVELVQRQTSRDVPAASASTTQSHREYGDINYQRTVRIMKTYTVSDRLRSAIGNIENPQLWMVLTEPWCGDSAQCLPYIAKIAECNPSIDLRLLLRDANPDIMDEFLTNGTRSIPKVIAFDAAGEEIFRWGPRPEEAQRIFLEGRTQGLSKQESLAKVHLWYGLDKGNAIEGEFLALVEGGRKMKERTV